MDNEAAKLVGELGLRADGLVPVVNSRDVAGAFGKLHRHVLRDINSLLEERPDLVSPAGWFRSASYLSEQGKKLPSFDLTRDGFTLLVMAWTGPQAMKFKVAYIQAFNAMEAELRARPVPSGGITAQELLAGLKEAIAPLAVRHDNHDHAIESVKSEVLVVKTDVASIKADMAFLKKDFYSTRKNLTDKTKRIHCEDLFDLGRRCPSCGKNEVVDSNGMKLPFTEFDHFYASSKPDAPHTWLICKPCHTELTTGRVERHAKEADFRSYQNKRVQLPGRQPPLLFG